MQMWTTRNNPKEKLTTEQTKEKALNLLEYRAHSRRELFDKLFKDKSDAILSMGMSESYTYAIEAGATMVRIGSAIFGERKYY